MRSTFPSYRLDIEAVYELSTGTKIGDLEWPSTSNLALFYRIW